MITNDKLYILCVWGGDGVKAQRVYGFQTKIHVHVHVRIATNHVQ